MHKKLFCMRELKVQLNFTYRTYENVKKHKRIMMSFTDYGGLVKKLPSLHEFLSTAKAYFVRHISPNFYISLIYAFIGCPREGSIRKGFGSQFLPR